MTSIAVFGAGAIGQTFALRLALAGHDVTLIARSNRVQLERAGGVVSAAGERASVRVVSELDASVAYDLVLVTVLRIHLAAIVPALVASRAKQFLTMFNVFDVDALDALNEQLGGRLLLGFPAIVASLATDGVLTTKPVGFPHGTLAGEQRWVALFADAGIPACLEPDMRSWLKSHASFIATLLAALNEAERRQRGLPWARARLYAAATNDAFDVVRAQGARVIPWWVNYVLGWQLLFAVVVFLLTRLASVRALGPQGRVECFALCDEILAAPVHHQHKLPLQMIALKSIRTSSH